jgi:hypothetical protein
MSEGSQQTTGTQDTSFNLVSVLYHALEGASTYEQYVVTRSRPAIRS